jgi:hypothetical protein
VEYFQRTLKAHMWQHKTRRYVDVLPHLVHGYNHTYHCSIRRGFSQVNAKNVLKVWKTLYETRDPLCFESGRLRTDQQSHTEI